MFGMVESEIKDFWDREIKTCQILSEISRNLEGLLNPKSESRYKCPICGKEHRLHDSVVVKQEVDKTFVNRKYMRHHSNSKTKVFVDTYRVKYYNVRICLKCAKRRNNVHECAAILTIVLIIIMIVRNIFSLVRNELDFVTFIIISIFALILGALIFICLEWLIGVFQVIDVEKAKKNNAIVTSDIHSDFIDIQ